MTEPEEEGGVVGRERSPEEEGSVGGRKRSSAVQREAPEVEGTVATITASGAPGAKRTKSSIGSTETDAEMDKWREALIPFAGVAKKPIVRESAERSRLEAALAERVLKSAAETDRFSEQSSASVANWVHDRIVSGKITDDFTDAEYDVLITAAREASRLNTGSTSGEVAEAAGQLRSAMSLRVGETAVVPAARGSFHLVVPDVGHLHESGLVRESRHFARRRYKRSTDSNVQTVRKHWFAYTLREARTSPVRPLVGSSLDAAMLEEDLWINFSSYLGRRVQGSTVGQYISLLKRWHKSVTGWDPIASSVTDNVMLKQTLGGIRAELPSANRKRFAHPTRLFREWRRQFEVKSEIGSLMDLEPFDLDKVPTPTSIQASYAYRAMMATTGGSDADLKYLTASSAMTAGLMRISEACPASQDQDVIHRSDVRFTWRADGTLERVGVLMTPLKKPKGTPKVEVVLANTQGNVRAAFFIWLTFFLDPVPKEQWASTPLFRNWSWETVKPSKIIEQSGFRNWYAQKMCASGVKHWRHYNLHSFRIGGATVLLAAGVSMEHVKAMGRWASDVCEIYTRPTREMLLKLSVAIDETDATPFEDADDAFFDRLAGVAADHEDVADSIADAITEDVAELEDMGE